MKEINLKLDAWFGSFRRRDCASLPAAHPAPEDSPRDSQAWARPGRGGQARQFS